MSDPNPSLWRQALLALLFAALLPLATNSLPLSGTILAFAIAAAGCNLLLGYAGLLSFAQGTFFGVGSYAAALLLKQWPALGFLVLLPVACAGVLVALAISLLSTRQKGIYFVMITLAMAQLAYFAALSFPEITGGENGLLDVPRPALPAVAGLSGNLMFYGVLALVMVLALGVLAMVVRSPFGQALEAIRENEVRAETLGFRIGWLKAQAFCLSGAFTAVAGALYAMQLRSAQLSAIDLLTSESILIMAILGGRRSMLGSALGAAAMLLMSEYLSAVWPRWQMIVGFVLIAVVLYFPHGLAGAWRQLGAPARLKAAWHWFRNAGSAPVEVR